VSFSEGEGPVIGNPVRDRATVERLRVTDGEELRYVEDAIKQARKALARWVPLIGFAGAPFTLASYAIEGGGSKNFIATKQFMYREPEAWHKLMDKLARVVTGYLRRQIRAGAEAVQLFDSWVGCLSPGDYAEYVLPHVQLISAALKREGVPLIHFGTGTATLLKLMREAGGDVIGVDWRLPRDDASATIRYGVVTPGCLGPLLVLALLRGAARRGRSLARPR